MLLDKKTKTELRFYAKSDRKPLFDAVWRKILWFNKNSEIDNLFSLYDDLVSASVNNPKSKFYIHG